MRMATNVRGGHHHDVSDATNVRSDVGNAHRPFSPPRRVTPQGVRQDTRHGGWRYPHRSRRHLVSTVLWWIVVAAGVTAAVYVARQG
jgi:hypothetical protein